MALGGVANIHGVLLACTNSANRWRRVARTQTGVQRPNEQFTAAPRGVDHRFADGPTTMPAQRFPRLLPGRCNQDTLHCARN
eukprot:8450453-Lingulodinium_polyedra.AAC.1